MELTERFKEIIDNFNDYILISSGGNNRYSLFYKPTYGYTLVEIDNEDYEKFITLLIEKGIEQSDTAPKPDASYRRKTMKWDDQKNEFVETYDE